MYAFQGSREYLRLTLAEMVKPGKPARMREIGGQVQEALEQGDVRYIRVSPQFRDNGTAYFSVQSYNLYGGG